MRNVILAGVLVLSSTVDAARSKPPSATGGWIASQKFTAVDHDHATLRIVLATSSTKMREVSAPITVPDHFVVTGFTLAVAGEELVGVARITDRAGGAYDRVVAQITDPGLLEWIDSHHVRVKVFPMTREASATLSIELTRIGKDTGTRVSSEISLLAAPDWADPGAVLVPLATPHLETRFSRVPEVVITR